MLFHGLFSISQVKNKKIQALVAFYVFLAQKIECMWTPKFCEPAHDFIAD